MLAPSSKKSGWLKKSLVTTVLVLAIVYVSSFAYLWWAMRQPPETIGRVMARMPIVGFIVFPFESMWTRARGGALHPGDPAPDFSLLTVDKSQRIQLSALYHEKPVVLVFGSYT